LNKKNSFKYANFLGSKKIPFVFISDFLTEKIQILTLDQLESENIHFSFCEDFQKNISKNFIKKADFSYSTVSYQTYLRKFQAVKKAIKKGDTYLFNLTQPTELNTHQNIKLIDIFKNAKAPFKIFYKNKFVSISPEIFVTINSENKISTFPMKGTIKLKDQNSELQSKKILASDEKENSEHIMIVDLMRNDLNRVAKKIKVEKFKNIFKINQDILQMNSTISGELNSNWRENIGSILEQILPAGSITGTPKIKTVELIQKIENYNRDFFTGVFGFFDGNSFKSAVMIRFIELNPKTNQLVYKSGGGITLDSEPLKEFKELQEKIYIY
jgi:para-aminobenzoate synthetase component 1